MSQRPGTGRRMAKLSGWTEGEAHEYDAVSRVQMSLKGGGGMGWVGGYKSSAEFFVFQLFT